MLECYIITKSYLFNSSKISKIRIKINIIIIKTKSSQNEKYF